MADLISRTAAIEHMKSMAGCDACNNYGGARCRACTWDDATNIVDELPAVDAAPVVHARWISSAIYKGYMCCSHCTEAYVAPAWLDEGKWRYCPACGAKLDGGEP